MKGLPDFASPDGESNLLSRVIYPQVVVSSLLGLALIGFGYATFLTFPNPVAYFYLSLAVVYAVVSVWILLNLQGHVVDPGVDEETESKHFLCANPICQRCAGYYGGLTATGGSGLELHERLVIAFEKMGIDPWIAVGGGFVLFVFTSPFHGAVKSIMRILLSNSAFQKSLESNRLKLLTGFVSGLSLLVALVGCLMILPE